MSLESDFRDLCAQSVTVRTRSGRNSDGSDTFSTAASTYRARVVGSKKWVRDSLGNVVQASQEVWILSTGTIAQDSRITLPDGTSPPVLQIATFPDGDGTHHNRVVCG